MAAVQAKYTHHHREFGHGFKRFETAVKEEDESVEEDDDDQNQQLRLEVPTPARRRSVGDRRLEGVHHRERGARTAAAAAGGPREGDLDVMSATSTALGDVHRSVSTSSQRERRAQIDCWCNIPDMFVDPASRVAYYWMALVTVAVVYNWIVIILRVAFEDMRDSEFHQWSFRVLDTISDLIYLMDVAIQSRTAYLEDGCLVKSLPETVRNYRNQPCFALDVLSVVPVNTVFFCLSIIGLPCPFNSGSNTLTTPGLRILRLLKYPSMYRFFEKTDREWTTSRTNNPNFLRAFRLSLHLWLVIHWIGCFYYLVSQYEGLGTNDWVYPNSTEFATFSRKYIYCMYWSTMTLTTIGERPWPATELEYMFTGVTFLIGVFVFAAVVGNVGDVISNMNAARHDFQARMDQIKFYLNHRNVPKHLQDQIKRWAEYNWIRTKAIDEHSVLQLLPNRLRTEVAIHVHLKTLKKVRIFEQCEEGLLRELVLKLRPSIYSPGEYICRIGEIGREMYIIDHGKVEILFPEHGSGQMKQVAIMMPGNYFGEISLLKLDDGQNKRTADVRSIGFSELLCLSRRDLMAALGEYPEAKRILESQARQRMQQTKRAPNETGAEHPGPLPVYPDQPESSSSSLATERSPGRRSARAIFAQVMKQEGFSKLLANAAGEEISEIKNILKELREIKNQMNQARKLQQQQQQQNQDMEMQHLQRDVDLQQIRTQLLLQPCAAVTPSNHTSPSTSTVNNAADLSSDTSTLTSPSVAHTAAGVKPSPTRPLPSPQNPPSPERQGMVPGGVSDQPAEHSANVVKSLSSVCSPKPSQNLAAGSPTLPSAAGTSSPTEGATAALNTRRRRSPTARIPKSVTKNKHENVDRLAEGTQDAVVQGGGGDEPAVQVAAVEKDPAMKDLDEGGLSAKKSTSSTTSTTTSWGSAPGSFSSFEFILTGSQEGFKPTELGSSTELLQLLAQSDSFKSLASASSNSSSYSSNYSTTSSSSGGRGHSPKPAKPRPRYRRDEPPDSWIHREGNGNSLEEFIYGKPETITNVVTQSKDKTDSLKADEQRPVSSLGFVTVSMCNSLDSVDSAKASILKAGPNAADKGVSADCTSIQNDTRFSMETGKSECILKTLGSDTAEAKRLSVVDKADLSPESNESSPESIREIPFTRMKDCIEEQDLNSVPASQMESVSKTLKMVEVLERNSVYHVGDDLPEEASVDSDDNDADSGRIFIPATRVKSDFDKRISEKELSDIPTRPITCQKISDTQLSTLLARRKEVNDSAAVESSDRTMISSVSLGKAQLPNSEHGHSVQSVTDSPSVTRCGDKLVQTTQKPPISADTANICQASEKDKPPSELSGSSCATNIESNYAKTDCSKSPAVSANPLEDIVYNETLITEYMKSTKNDEPTTPVCADSHSESSERVGASSGVKEKTYPVSILKKHRPKQQSGNQCDSQTIQHSECPDMPSSYEGAISPAAEAESLLENGTEMLTQRADEEKHGSVKDSDGKQSSVEYTSSNCLNSSKQQSNKVHERSPDKDELSVMKLSDDLDQDTHAQAPSVESTSKTMSDDTQDLPSVISSAEAVPQQFTDGKENETVPSQYHGQSADKKGVSMDIPSVPVSGGSKGDVSAVTTSRLPSAAGSNKNQSVKRYSEKLESLIATFDPGAKKTPKDDGRNDAQDSSIVTQPKTDTINQPEVTTDSRETTDKSQVNLAEKGTVDEPVVGSVETCSLAQSSAVESVDEARSDNRSTVSPGFPYNPRQRRKCLRRRGLTRRTSSPSERKEGSCEDKAEVCCSEQGTDAVSSAPNVENKEESALTVPESQMTENKEESAMTAPESQIAENKEKSNVTESEPQITETKENKVESVAVVGESQIAENTGENVATAPESEIVENKEESITIAPGSQITRNEEESVVTTPEPQITENKENKEDMVMTATGPQSAETEGETVVTSQEPQIAENKEEKILTDQDPEAQDRTTCVTLVKNLVWEMAVDVKPLFTDEAVGCDEEVCGQGGTLPSPCQTKVPDSNINVSGSDPASACTKTTSSDNGLSFKDEIQDAADRFMSGEILDKANNSAVVRSPSFRGSSKSECMITKPVCASNLLSSSADLTQINTAIVEDVCFQAPFDVNRITTSTSCQAFRTTSHAVSTPTHFSMVQPHMQATGEANFERGGEWNPDPLVRLESPFHQDVGEESHGHREPSDSTCPQHYNSGCGLTMASIQQAGTSSDDTCPADPAPGSSEQDARSLAPDHQQQQMATSEITPEVEHHHHNQNGQKQERHQELPSDLLHQQTQGVAMLADESLGGSSIVQALHLHPSLLDSPGASSTDDSTGEWDSLGEAQAEDDAAASSLILLADFGVEDEDDDEGALSGLDCCEDHSDVNTDLDDL